MNRNDALKLLGLDKAATALTPEIVAEAFKTAMRAGHPDSPDYTADKHIHSVAVYQEARKVLLTLLDGDDSACKLCQGVKMVRGKFGWRECSICHGTGVRR